MPSELPQKPSIRFLKELAKDIASLKRRNRVSAWRVLRHLQRFTSLTDKELLDSEVQLSEVHYALAKEYGTSNWTGLLQKCKEEKTLKNQKFEDTILKLDDRAIQRFLREIDTWNLSVVLDRSPEILRIRIFANMSKRAVELLKEEMIYSSTPTIEMFEEAQQGAMKLLNRLIEENEISIDLNNGKKQNSKRAVKAAYAPVELITEGIDPAKASAGQFNNLFYQLALKKRINGVGALRSDSELVRDKTFSTILARVAENTSRDSIELLIKQTAATEITGLESKNQMLINAVLKIQDGTKLEIPQKADCKEKELLEMLSNKAAKEGLLALERDIRVIENEIIKTGMDLVVDGTDPGIVQQIMENKAKTMQRKSEVWFEKVREGFLGLIAGDPLRMILIKLESLD